MKNKILCYIATLGTLLAATGCTTTYVVSDKFQAPQQKNNDSAKQEKVEVRVEKTVPTVIEAQPLQIHVAPVVTPVYYGVPYYINPYYIYRGPHRRPPYRPPHHERCR